MLGPVDLRDMVGTMLTIFIVDWDYDTRWCFARFSVFFVDRLRVLVSFHDHILDLLWITRLARCVCTMRLVLGFGAECRVILPDFVYVIGCGFRCGECLMGK